MHEPKEIQVRQAVGAAVIGNVLEWYDFAVYAYLAGVIGKNFFPSDNEITSLLATFAVFGVGFVVRPLGGIVIGWIGDQKGRKVSLLLTIFLMAAGPVRPRGWSSPRARSASPSCGPSRITSCSATCRRSPRNTPTSAAPRRCGRTRSDFWCWSPPCR